MSTYLQIDEISIAEQLYKELEGIELNPSTLVTTVTGLMKSVERVKKLKGTQKKNIVLYTLSKFIKDNVSDSEHLETIVNLTVPGMIDTIVLLDTNKIKIKASKCFSNIFLSCCK